MPKRIAIAVAEQLAKEQGLKQVVIIGWDGELNHCVTYGIDKAQCEQAAVAGKLWIDLMALGGKKEAIQRLRAHADRLSLEL